MRAGSCFQFSGRRPCSRITRATRLWLTGCQPTFDGDIVPAARLINGRYTLTLTPDHRLAKGTKLYCQVNVQDREAAPLLYRLLALPLDSKH